MKLAILSALATAATIYASPIQERQGSTFPTECTTACSAFLPVYNTCSTQTTLSGLNACLQPICAPATFDQLPACLSCWSTATGQSSAIWLMYFQTICA